MKNYLTFTKKELVESSRTYKLLIMLTVFFIFGMMSPLTAKILPQILSQFMPEGITITLPEPSAIDSWGQFFKNISQMGLILMVIVFSGVLSTELSRGTLINILTKGLSRSTVILSKYTGMAVIWTTSLVLAFLVCWGYTAYLFPGSGIVNLLFSVFCLWLFGMFLLAVLLFASTLIKNNYGCMVITGAIVVVLTICNIVPVLKKINPYSLVVENVSLLTNITKVQDLVYSVLATGICIAALVAFSVLVFRKRQL